MLDKSIKKRLIISLSLVIVSVFILSTETRANLYGFAAISDNSGISGQMAQQLSLEVTPYGSNQVLFDFKNNIAPYASGSPVDGIIGGLFFEDGALLGVASIIEDPFNVTNPVDFETPLNPASKSFPEGNTLSPPFQTTAHFWATSSGTISNGVNPGEQVGLVFDLKGGNTFANVITAINLGFTNPNPGGNTSLRIGIHVQNLGGDEDGDGVPGDYSDSYILTPIPASVILGILGMGVVGIKLRKYA
ncbi:MAG: hypothetical protein ACYS17_02410 [Planctomycetota bacterium]|jgi:hypothetical protein